MYADFFCWGPKVLPSHYSLYIPCYIADLYALLGQGTFIFQAIIRENWMEAWALKVSNFFIISKKGKIKTHYLFLEIQGRQSYSYISRIARAPEENVLSLGSHIAATSLSSAQPTLIYSTELGSPNAFLNILL